jgi:hypothetical protein
LDVSVVEEDPGAVQEEGGLVDVVFTALTVLHDLRHEFLSIDYWNLFLMFAINEVEVAELDVSVVEEDPGAVQEEGGLVDVVFTALTVLHDLRHEFLSIDYWNLFLMFAINGPVSHKLLYFEVDSWHLEVQKRATQLAV